MSKVKKIFIGHKSTIQDINDENEEKPEFDCVCKKCGKEWHHTNLDSRYYSPILNCFGEIIAYQIELTIYCPSCNSANFSATPNQSLTHLVSDYIEAQEEKKKQAIKAQEEKTRREIKSQKIHTRIYITIALLFAFFVLILPVTIGLIYKCIQ